MIIAMSVFAGCAGGILVFYTTVSLRNRIAMRKIRKMVNLPSHR